MDKQTVVYSYYGLFIIHQFKKEEETTDTHNMDAPHKHAEQNLDKRAHREWLHLYECLGEVKLVYRYGNQISGYLEWQ